MNKITRVAILGCGPAGLFAAHASVGAGARTTIFSKARKSHMRGAQYLHRPIPGLTTGSFNVEYKLKGSVEGYRNKVYGDVGDILVSPESLVGVAPAWDIRQAYDQAWDLYGDKVVDVDFSTMGDPQGFIGNLLLSYDIVLSTIPAPILCRKTSEHQFKSQMVWSTENLKSLGEFGFESDETLRDNLVVCSGDPEDWWYRQSRIMGWENTEFPHDQRPTNFSGKIHEVGKPISNDCDCNTDIIRMGRYGKWQKGILSHEAFEETAREVVAIRKGWSA